jgi:hypothetical protein
MDRSRIASGARLIEGGGDHHAAIVGAGDSPIRLVRAIHGHRPGLADKATDQGHRAFFRR